MGENISFSHNWLEIMNFQREILNKILSLFTFFTKFFSQSNSLRFLAEKLANLSIYCPKIILALIFVTVLKIITEFRILMLTFLESKPQNTELQIAIVFLIHFSVFPKRNGQF